MAGWAMCLGSFFTFLISVSLLGPLQEGHLLNKCPNAHELSTQIPSYGYSILGLSHHNPPQCKQCVAAKIPVHKVQHILDRVHAEISVCGVSNMVQQAHTTLGNGKTECVMYTAMLFDCVSCFAHSVRHLLFIQVPISIIDVTLPCMQKTRGVGV